jgi:PPOX class probable F420-dependent enzyme
MPSEPDLTLRRATAEDAGRLASLFVDAREAAFPQMPRSIHPPASVHSWFAELLGAPDAAQGRETWLAERDGDIVGYLVLAGSWLDSLYVRPGLTGQGIGSVLLDLVKGMRPDGFSLWVFESNTGAQTFYRRHGLVTLRRTDGTGNEERSPDREMAWLGADPVAALRRRVDDVDDEVAVLLEQRAGLTALIQQHKEVPGRAGRDREREDAIVARMSRLAPTLGVDRVRRIMLQVIGESLDAAAPDDPAAPPTSAAPLPDDVRRLLAKPNPAVIASLRPDGQPVTVATWYLLDGDRILVNLDEGRTRLEYLRRDPRVSLTALDEESWYTHVSVRGRVVEIRDDPDLVDIDRLSRHYTDRPHANRDRRRVSAWIEIDAWHRWGAGRT